MDQEPKNTRQFISKEEFQARLNAEPEVQSWVNRKKGLQKLGLVLLAVFFVLEIMAYNRLGIQMKMRTEIFRIFIAFFWYILFISPTGPWRLNIMFYVSGLVNLLTMFKTFSNGINMERLLENPVVLAYLIMSCLIPVYFLILACYLTIPQKHRMLSDRAAELAGMDLDKINRRTQRSAEEEAEARRQRAKICIPIIVICLVLIVVCLVMLQRLHS